LWTARPDGSVDWVNERATDYFGLRDLLADGEDWVETVHPDERVGSDLAYLTAIRNCTHYEMELRSRRHDGLYRCFLAEDANTRARDRFWQLSQDLLVVCEFTGSITAVNAAVTRILGWAEDEFTGHNSSLYPFGGSG
jgi:PAS domain-containing protein